MPARKRFLWQVFPQYLVLIVLLLTALTIVSTSALKKLYLQRTQVDLEARGHLIGRLLLSDPENLSGKIFLNQQVRDLAAELKTRITIVLPDGRIAADSDENYRIMDNHMDRPEIRTAFQGQTGMSKRYSYTLKQQMLYIAVPVHRKDQCIAVVRTSMPSISLSNALRRIYRQILFTGLIVVLIAGLIGFIYGYYLSKPIKSIKEGASRMGLGELHHRIFVDKPEELKNIADSINQMAGQLRERIDLISNQRNKLEAVFSNMVEAVLVVDTDEHVMGINHAFSELFQIHPDQGIGKNLQETVRHISLQRFVQKALDSPEPLEEELVIARDNDRMMQAHGTSLLDSSGKKTGALIVLNDITRQKTLENIRREFVANVSHELKTPITAIHGFVETLRGGAIRDKKKAGEYLDIIARHTNRLDHLIEDLLSLSRIEQEAEKNAILLSPGEIGNVIDAAVSFCMDQAGRRKIKLKSSAPNDLHANINAPLLERALVNLMDNAIKYSPEKSNVFVSTRMQDEFIVIEVSDNGCGIPEKDLPRIFERFYRVDKARSRDSGGTGLGLSIVKHIAEAHGGRISVISESGKGSTFTLCLPGIKENSSSI